MKRSALQMSGIAKGSSDEKETGSQPGILIRQSGYCENEDMQRMKLKMQSFHEMRQRGFGLLDVILASVLLLGALAGIIVLFNNAQLSNNVTETGQAASTMSSEIRGLYRTSSNFEGLDTQQVIDSGIAPANLIIEDEAGDDEIQTPFGGGTTIAFEPDEDGSPEFEMTMSGLSDAACERLTAGASTDIDDPSAAGVLGTNYAVTSECDAEGDFTATYLR